jgi:hypothetical protein
LGDESFEGVRGQIGYCGIWCGSCVVGNGALRELTRRYEELVRAYGLEGWAPGNFDFGEFKKGLMSIQAMPLCSGCRRGGGRDSCEIRACSSRRLKGCTECGKPDNCENLELLLKMRAGAVEAGLMVKNENVDQGELIERWTSELRGKWPSRILFQIRE